MDKASSAMKQLPDKPSELIRLAIADLRKCERSRRFKVDFGYLFSPDNEDVGKTAVCLAGSVMAQTLKMDPKRLFAKPGLVGSEHQYKIYALESIGLGCFKRAFAHLNITPPAKIDELPRPTSYAIDPEAFKQDCLDIADQLEAAGH